MVQRENPAITVYVPCHNYGQFLQEALESVFKQTFEDWELLIIDDGSSDNTPDIIQLYKNVPNIRTFRTEGIKLPAVCNLAIREAKGKYIIRLDGDDVFDENILLNLYHYLERNPDTIMVFPDYYLMDQLGNIFSHERRRKLYEEDHILDLPPNGACILAKTEILRELGGYREDLGAQDGFDLWVRIREKYKCGNINLPLFYYRRHFKNLTGADNESPTIKFARQKIKKDITAKNLEQSRPIIGVIPVRQYFDFTENCWSAELNNKTLLHYAMQRMAESDTFDKILVVSDTPDVKQHLNQINDPRIEYVSRTFESTFRTAPLSEMLRVAIEPYDPKFKGITVINYVQAPFLTLASLEEAIHTLLLNDADASLAVEAYDDENFFIRNAYGLQRLDFHRFQYIDGGKIYRDTNVCTAVKNINIKKGNIRGPRLVPYTITGVEGFFISDDYRHKVAQLIASHMLEKKKALAA